MEQEHDSGAVGSLELTARVIEILTVVLIVLVSPLSFVIIAVLVGLVGFGAATTYHVKANTARKSASARR